MVNGKADIADIKVFREKILLNSVKKHLNQNPKEKWFSNPKNVALIYIVKQPLNLIKESENFRTFRKMFYEDSIGIFNYFCILKDDCQKNFGEVKETVKLIEFILERINKGVKRFFIVEQEKEEIAISIAYAIAKYIFEDENLANYFDTPFHQIDEEIIEKIIKAYTQELKWRLEYSTFTYGTSLFFGDFKEHIFNREEKKSFCGKFKANGLGQIPFYEDRYDTFYDWINAPENDIYICQVCKKAYNKRFKPIYEKLKKLEKFPKEIK